MYKIWKEYVVSNEDQQVQYFKCFFNDVTTKDASLKIKGLISTPEIDRHDDIVNQKGLNEAMEAYMIFCMISKMYSRKSKKS